MMRQMSQFKNEQKILTDTSQKRICEQSKAHQECPMAFVIRKTKINTVTGRHCAPYDGRNKKTDRSERWFNMERLEYQYTACGNARWDSHFGRV